MHAKTDFYRHNPLTTRDRRLALSPSAWARSFACEDMGILIVCRGPIRKEALDVFAQMGIARCGILLSEKDSIVYTQALAPELRLVDPARVHRVKDYSGASKEERNERMAQIVAIAREHGYGYIFAGYGFMAEDADFVRTIEEAGLRFMGPCSRTQRAAGSKDEAKRTALAQQVSVTPGVNDVTARALRAKVSDRAGLQALCAQHQLAVAAEQLAALPFEEALEAALQASYRKGIDLLSTDELGAQVVTEVTALLAAYPGSRVRLKAIGGGGGKGQRILPAIAEGDPATAQARAAEAARPAAELFREVLAEVKATGVGDNKNVLLELNIEQTRHNEIQLLGNGQWSISLGGRDCSLQMHEQKLLEVSITQEALAAEVARSRAAGRTVEAEALETDLRTLTLMEAEAERFALAVGLDSASTFECIVERGRHYFMEVNTRIQVEHRVSELCYGLRFRNPEAAEDSFEVHSLVEAMALLARHGARLPRPERFLREGAALEARLNATDRALSPHAGGVIHSWTDAIEGEIRDDQGICVKNPDTGMFMHYRLAGAYDSNIALLVTARESRQEAYEHLGEILRRTRIRGHELSTNLEFHYGLLHWFLARNVYAKPTTRFVVPYLTLVGALKQEADAIDLPFAFAQLAAHHEKLASSPQAAAATREILALKETLLRRPIEHLFAEPHYLSAWLSAQHRSFRWEHGALRWLRNPLQVLAETYHLLDMDHRPGAPAAHVIWDHDQDLLARGLLFYQRLAERLPGLDFPSLDALLDHPEPPDGFSPELWARTRASHRGFQLGLSLLGILPLLGERARFFDLKLEDDLTITIPPHLLDPDLQTRMRRVLVPPPATRDGELVAVSGGMFYGQEAPDRPPLVQVGDHFEKGQPIYIIEVMKMFNKVSAPFSGRIDEILVAGEGTIVQKGQPLFRVTPDERAAPEDPAALARRRKESTRGALSTLLPPPASSLSCSPMPRRPAPSPALLALATLGAPLWVLAQTPPEVPDTPAAPSASAPEPPASAPDAAPDPPASAPPAMSSAPAVSAPPVASSAPLPALSSAPPMLPAPPATTAPLPPPRPSTTASAAPAAPPPRPAEARPTGEKKDEKKDEKKERGLEWLWLSGEGGLQYLSLTTLSSEGRLVPGIEKTSATGPFGGVAAGIRLWILAIGLRARAAQFDQFMYWSLNPELRIHFGNQGFQPYLLLSGGYSALGSLDKNTLSNQAGATVRGFNIRAGFGLDAYLTDTITLGLLGTGEVTAMTRPGVSASDLDVNKQIEGQGSIDTSDPAKAQAQLEAQRAEAEAKAARVDGSGVGLAGSLSVVLGLHFLPGYSGLPGGS
ncbi:MAG: biotin carboxylase [Polyangiaceae bacterium]|nr:biotin carboxylase [Polyangiaceae bacterium]